jgi:CheY-like chemotaxis protein
MMDCQMPLMDGFQATRFIRELERVTGQHTAIIGISAFASAEACFIAGMDDFLSKPLNKLLLKVVLGRWIREKKGSTMNLPPIRKRKVKSACEIVDLV